NVKITSSHRVLMVALLAAAFACYLLVEPYINSIVMAFIISLLMFPIHEWFEQKIPKHPNMAALLSCVVLTFIIVIPLLFVFAAIVQQGSVFSQNTYNWVTNGGIQDIFQHPFVIKGLAIVNEYLPFDKIEPKAIAEKIGQFATSFGSNLVAISAKILGDATNFLMNFFLMLFVLFFLLRDHDKIISAIRHILPLSRSQEDRILTEIEQVSKSAVMGSFMTAIAQGLAGGIGM
ncbi:AI-2E family transporter, partial [Vibrio parahaemolyticus]|nr:AI-2E family transporter [Vibrio parahaemolyticus]